MTLEIQIEHRDEYLYLKFSEKIDFSVFKQSLKQLYTDLYKYKVTKILLDFNEYDFEGFSTRKRTIAAMILLDVFHNVSDIKIAVFMDNNNYDGTVKKYADMKGIDIEMFFTENEAIQWLNKKD